MSLMRCFKCLNFLHTTIVPSQIWDDTDNNCKWVYYYFYSAFSLIPIKISLHLHRLIYALSLTSLFNHFFALSPSTPHHCLPLWRNLGRSIKLGRSLLLWVFFFFLQWFDTRISNGWVKMVIGGSVVLGGSTGGGRIGGGANLCFDLFLFFCFGGCDLVVDLAVVVGWFWWLWFFFFYGDYGRNNFSGCCWWWWRRGRNLIYYFNVL